MTEQQMMFIVGKKYLKLFEDIEKERQLTYEERKKKDEIQTSLFGSIALFGISMARKRIARYRKSEDALQDIRQDLALIFFEKLPNYDPSRSAPTTYFRKYFDQVITEYVLKYSQHMTQYTASNVSKVRAAIKYCESQGIRWDEPLLVTITGLSAKVVKKTLHQAETSIYANIDEMINLQSNLPSPEEEYISNERLETLERALGDTLSDEDRELFLFKVNPFGDRERSFKEVATYFGLQEREVKQRYNNILAELNANKELRSYNPNGGRSADPKVHLPQQEGVLDEELIFQALRDVPLHNAGEFDAENGDDSIPDEPSVFVV